LLGWHDAIVVVTTILRVVVGVGVAFGCV